MNDQGELEQAVRGALESRAVEITSDSLRFPTMPPQRSPASSDRAGRRTWVLVAASVVCVLALGVVISVLQPGSDRHGGHQNYAAAPGSFYTGKQWSVETVTQGAHEVTHPATLRATISFADGKIEIYDGVNELSGHYRSTSDGFVVIPGGTTYRLYAGHNPAAKLIMAALNAVVFGRVGTAGSASSVDNRAFADGQQLVIRTGGYEVRLTQIGSAPTAPSASTSTSS